MRCFFANLLVDLFLPPMASFVYNTSDASARFGSQLTQAQQLASIDHCEVSILEWPMNGEIKGEMTMSPVEPSCLPCLGFCFCS